MSDKEYIYGINHVTEILTHAPDQLQEVWLEQGVRTDALAGAAAASGVRCRVVSREEMRLAGGPGARHALAVLGAFAYAELEDLVASCGPRALFLALDSVTDPGNLGAILRSARFFGAAGVILPRDRCVAVNATVFKRSAGAAAAVPVARVTNLSRALRALKDAGFWVYGTTATGGVDPAGESYADRSCLVLGAEGGGIRAGVLKHCDVNLTLAGEWESLNVASCAAVLMYVVSGSCLRKSS